MRISDWSSDVCSSDLKIYGIEAEITAKPTRALQFDLSGSYLHSEFTDFISADSLRPLGDGVSIDNYGQPAFNLKGNRLPLSPKLSGRLGAASPIDADVGAFKPGGDDGDRRGGGGG